MQRGSGTVEGVFLLSVVAEAVLLVRVRSALGCLSTANSGRCCAMSNIAPFRSLPVQGRPNGLAPVATGHAPLATHRFDDREPAPVCSPRVWVIDNASALILAVENLDPNDVL